MAAPANPMIYGVQSPGAASGDLGLGAQLADDVKRQEDERRKRMLRMGGEGQQGGYGDPSAPLSAAGTLFGR